MREQPVYIRPQGGPYVNLGEDVAQGQADSVLPEDVGARKDKLSSKKVQTALRPLKSATLLHSYPNSLPVPKSTIELG